MRIHLTIYIKILFVLSMTLTHFSTNAVEASDDSETVYVSSDHPMDDVQKALVKAKSSNKLLLIVMGAQWCHDSRGLAKNFENEELANLLQENYELIYVDVGYYKDLRSISQRFDQAHYFATPTVMIINAQNERLINAKDMHIWGSADSIPLAKYLRYFTDYANNPSPTLESLPDNKKTLISVFEQLNAERLSKAYRVLTPFMEIEDRTEKENDLFYDYWNEVKEFRISLQKDIQFIREQAINSPDEPILFPTYPSFSWESDI